MCLFIEDGASRSMPEIATAKVQMIRKTTPKHKITCQEKICSTSLHEEMDEHVLLNLAGLLSFKHRISWMMLAEDPRALDGRWGSQDQTAHLLNSVQNEDSIL